MNELEATLHEALRDLIAAEMRKGMAPQVILQAVINVTNTQCDRHRKS